MPQYVVILPRNIKQEVVDQLRYIRDGACRFVTPIPEVTVF